MCLLGVISEPSLMKCSFSGILMALFVLLAGSRGFADMGPSFLLEDCCLWATDIFLADWPDHSRPEVVATETILGRVAAGERVKLLGIEKLPEKGYSDYRDFLRGRKQEGGAKELSRKKLVVFATRLDDGALVSPLRPYLFPGWDFVAAVVLIEDGKVFAYQQPVNPGPSAVMGLGGKTPMDLAALKEDIARELASREKRQAEVLQAWFERYVSQVRESVKLAEAAQKDPGETEERRQALAALSVAMFYRDEFLKLTADFYPPPIRKMAAADARKVDEEYSLGEQASKVPRR